MAKQFSVKITHDCTASAEVYVLADTPDEAIEKALKMPSENPMAICWEMDDGNVVKDPYVADPSTVDEVKPQEFVMLVQRPVHEILTVLVMATTDEGAEEKLRTELNALQSITDDGTTAAMRQHLEALGHKVTAHGYSDETFAVKGETWEVV
jgi:hypothetical protein